MRRPTFARTIVSARRRVSRLAALSFSLLAGAMVISGLLLPASDAFAAGSVVNQCNGVGPSAKGATTGMTCTVTVVNTIKGSSRGSVTTLTRSCSLGPCAPGNGTFVIRSTSLVTSVNQCNGSDNDSAHPINCRVTITNNISANTPGARPVTSATVNECVGSATGGGGSKVCDPYPASTTTATVTQCNGSGTGGGGTVHCTVASASKVSPAIRVRVNQCNGTGNPGGSIVNCSTRLTTNITPAFFGFDTNFNSGQVSEVPSGGVAAGGGSTAGLHDIGLLMLGGFLLLAASISAIARRRVVGAEHSER